jgi:pyruvoyl-dependent arginine decarboxylase (PvlArgDC)
MYETINVEMERALYNALSKLIKRFNEELNLPPGEILEVKLNHYTSTTTGDAVITEGAISLVEMMSGSIVEDTEDWEVRRNGKHEHAWWYDEEGKRQEE